jgi:hypothetical protein
MVCLSVAFVKTPAEPFCYLLFVSHDELAILVADDRKTGLA